MRTISISPLSAAIFRESGELVLYGDVPVGSRLRVGDIYAVVVEARDGKIRVKRYDPGPRPGAAGHTPEKRQEILAAIREGLTDRAVAARCQCSSKTAWKLRTQAGIVRSTGYRMERRRAA